MRSPAPLRWAAACLAAMLTTPSAALAGTATGGATAPGGDPVPPPAAVGGTVPVPPVPVPVPPPAPLAVNTLRPPPAMVGSVAVVHGRLTPGAAGRTVVLALSDRARGWIAVGTGRADAAGAFTVSWRPKHLGRFLLRASFAGRAAAAAPTATIEVYRSVIATWFGPGSYGSRTACGEILTPALVGVAHRTLPCGTMVDIVYGGQTMSVPVVDRGPYANGASIDLTTATAAALGVTDTVRIGALAVPTAP